jgi:nitrite reductase/ring-hydroxylating ferredoxin subunit
MVGVRAARVDGQGEGVGGPTGPPVRFAREPGDLGRRWRDPDHHRRNLSSDGDTLAGRVGGVNEWRANGEYALAVRGLAALVLSFILLACSPGDETDDGWVTVGSVETLLAERVLYVPDHGVFVLPLSNGQLLAVSDDAQHIEGETVRWCAAVWVFIGLHGELFDREGQYIGGPARTDLDLIPVRVDGPDIQIEAGTVFAAVDRSHALGSDASVCEGEETRPGFVGPEQSAP